MTNCLIDTMVHTMTKCMTSLISNSMSMSKDRKTKRQKDRNTKNTRKGVKYCDVSFPLLRCFETKKGGYTWIIGIIFVCEKNSSSKRGRGDHTTKTHSWGFPRLSKEIARIIALLLPEISIYRGKYPHIYIPSVAQPDGSFQSCKLLHILDIF